MSPYLLGSLVGAGLWAIAIGLKFGWDVVLWAGFAATVVGYSLLCVTAWWTDAR